MRRFRFEPNLARREKDALVMLEGWYSDHPGAFVSVSGGKDSVAVLDLVLRVDPGAPVVFYDSGLEFPQTLAYLAMLEELLGFDLVRIPARPSALEVMAVSGQWEHGVVKLVGGVSLQEALIDRPAAEANARFGAYSVYGLRAQESRARRALLYSGRGVVCRHDRGGSLRYSIAAPLWQWTYGEVLAYLDQRGIRPHPLYAAMGKLGVPESKARVGPLIEGNSLEKGRWAIARRLAPDLCRRVEVALPVLRDLH